MIPKPHPNHFFLELRKSTPVRKYYLKYILKLKEKIEISL